MLENKLFALKLTLNFIRYGFPPILIIFIVWGIKLFDVTPDQTITYVITTTIGSAVIYLYFLGKYYLLVKTLTNYINALKIQDFTQALTFGRSYYSIERKGIKGAGGSGLTIYDETAINNDISAYSKVISS
ncbi:MAG: hypothetical protein JWQ79_1863 [Mucilaginibacter sp.]|nr:hypothetical protein [Mucilaginibacter sp.]